MAIKTIIELQAKPGQRDQLMSIMDEVTTMQAVPGFLGFEFYEVLENPDGLVEIAGWESPEMRQTWIQQSMDSGRFTF